MLNSKVIDILKTFSNVEIKRFSEFLISPFLNKNKKAVSLFELLSKYHPGYENKNLTKEKLFAKLFPGDTKGYNDASMRNLFSDLLILTEKYLAYVRFEKNKFDFNEKILGEVSDRKLNLIFEKKLRILEDIVNLKEFEGEEQFYRKFIVEEHRSSNRQFRDNLNLYKDDSGLKASEYLSYYYLIKLFKFANLFEFQKLYNVNHDQNFAALLLEGFNMDKAIEGQIRNSNSKKDISILKVYYRMYRSITNPGRDDYYFDFKNSLLENDSLFSPLEKLGLYICLTNSCVRKIDSGRNEFSRECFDIYMLMFGKDLYSAYPGYFPMSAFSAILHTGLAAEEFDRVESFINAYTSKLNPAHVNDATNYSLAQLNFHKKEFGKSLEYISKTDTDFSQFKFLLKILSLKIYYELKDLESLYYASDSFQHFLNKNKLVGENYRSEFSNFIKVLDLLVKYRSLKEEKIYFKIEHLLKSKSVAGRKWLEEKLNELSDLAGKNSGSGRDHLNKI